MELSTQGYNIGAYIPRRALMIHVCDATPEYTVPIRYQMQNYAACVCVAIMTRYSQTIWVYVKIITGSLRIWHLGQREHSTWITANMTSMSPRIIKLGQQEYNIWVTANTTIGSTGLWICVTAKMTSGSVRIWNDHDAGVQLYLLIDGRNINSDKVVFPITDMRCENLFWVRNACQRGDISAYMWWAQYFQIYIHLHPPTIFMMHSHWVKYCTHATTNTEHPRPTPPRSSCRIKKIINS